MNSVSRIEVYSIIFIGILFLWYVVRWVILESIKESSEKLHRIIEKGLIDIKWEIRNQNTSIETKFTWLEEIAKATRWHERPTTASELFEKLEETNTNLEKIIKNTDQLESIGEQLRTYMSHSTSFAEEAILNFEKIHDHLDEKSNN